MADIPTYTLNDGTTLPAIGFGTYPLAGEDGTEAMRLALDAGYRLLDTAVNYENEREVGEAIRRSGLPREEVRVASKVPGRHHAYDDADRLGPRVARAARHRLRRPAPDPLAQPGRGRYVEAWQALGRLPEGRAGPLGRRLQLHRGTPGPDHRRDRRHPVGEPDRAPPALPAAGDAAGRTSGLASAPRRGARWASAGRPWRSRRSRRRPRPTTSPPARSSCAGTCSSGRCPSRSPPTRDRQAPEPRRLRLRAHRRRDGGDQRPGRAGRPPLRRRPRHPRGDVTLTR